MSVKVRLGPGPTAFQSEIPLKQLNKFTGVSHFSDGQSLFRSANDISGLVAHLLPEGIDRIRGDLVRELHAGSKTMFLKRDHISDSGVAFHIP